MKKRLLLVAATLVAGGCVTQFTGSPRVEGRPRCEQICKGWDMELTGMVQLGEYSSGCICQVPGKTVGPQAAAAAGEAAAGVWVQTQASQASASRQGTLP